jgi:hypothetical protein
MPAGFDAVNRSKTNFLQTALPSTSSLGPGFESRELGDFDGAQFLLAGEDGAATLIAIHGSGVEPGLLNLKGSVYG